MNSDGEPQVVIFKNHLDIAGLKQGQPSLFLLKHNKAELLEAPTLFLHEHYVQSGKSASPNTWAAAADALKSWWDFLYAIERSNWTEATRQDRLDYRDYYLTAISPRTGQEYDPGTPRNRMVVIREFYRFAWRKGWYFGDIATTESDAPKELIVPIDEDALAHIRRGTRLIKRIDRDLPHKRKGYTNIRPFIVATELRPFLHHIGPRASERGDDNRSSRNRLFCDLGWAVGLRLDEIQQLKTLQFLNLHTDPSAPLASQRLTVLGKGAKNRAVAIPNWLVDDAIAYIVGERSEALKAGGLTSKTACTSLFLADSSSNFPGKPVKHRRLQQIVEEACFAIGLVDRIEIKDIETGEISERNKAKHCVHDLRHTYAVLTYHVEINSGNSEPWKKIQAQLGHANLTVTINTYLSFVEIFGERQGLVDVRKMIGI